MSRLRSVVQVNRPGNRRSGSLAAVGILGFLGAAALVRSTLQFKTGRVFSCPFTNERLPGRLVTHRVQSARAPLLALRRRRGERRRRPRRPWSATFSRIRRDPAPGRRSTRADCSHSTSSSAWSSSPWPWPSARRPTTSTAVTCSPAWRCRPSGSACSRCPAPTSAATSASPTRSTARWGARPSHSWVSSPSPVSSSRCSGAASTSSRSSSASSPSACSPVASCGTGCTAAAALARSCSARSSWGAPTRSPS